MAAINLLKELEFEGAQATPEQQEILSRYVGWGGLADAFDESKDNWKDEFAELYATLSPEEYAAARASTLNAHYTSPTVIKAIYEAVGNMGFQTGIILEPAMGVGNFFGMLPESMESKPARTAWSWIPLRDASPSSSIPRQTLPWQALKPPTDGISSTFPSATCPLTVPGQRPGLQQARFFHSRLLFCQDARLFDPAA